MLNRFLLPVSNFIMLGCFAMHPPTAMAQDTRSIEWDRINAVQDSAEVVLRSKEATHLYYKLVQQSKTDPHLKRAMDLENKLIRNQQAIDRKNAEIEVLHINNSKNIAQKNLEIKKLQAAIEELKYEQYKSKKAKKALFAAKVAGASLTTISLYFQIRNILDALRRVEIKERDLISRKNSLVTDQAKLELLEGKAGDAKANFRNTQSNSAATAAEIAKAERLIQDAEIELVQWKDVVNRSQQKIIDAEETARIDQRSITRQRISVGITAIGTLVIGLFGDKIILKLEEWLESDDPQDQEENMLSFIREWNKIKVEPLQASMLPSMKKAKLTPSQKSAVFFMTSSELGLKKGIVERALARYKRENPNGYSRLKQSAQKLLIYNMLESFENANWRIVLEQDEKQKEKNRKLNLFTAVRDNTNVVLPKPMPYGFGTKNKYKPDHFYSFGK